MTNRGGPTTKPRWAGAPPRKKKFYVNFRRNPVRTPWIFSSAPLGFFRSHPMEFFIRTPWVKNIMNLYYIFLVKSDFL
ncbi:hypothetical protein HanRHA438_Chr04g0193801 [Helianthus annuus]|nr:hypothetical protein HanRHA438_Chr04g0193801 [Helianthus annuus]